MRPLAVVGVLALLLAGCVESGGQRGPVSAADGLQLTGTLEGHRVAVSDGEPEVTYGDCDPADGRDVDLCIIARTVDGQQLGVVFENPDALLPGSTITVATRRCVPADCDTTTDVLLIEVRVDGRRLVASGGSVTVREAGRRWAGELLLRFADGSALSGDFDVRSARGR